MPTSPYRLVDGRVKVQIEDILGTNPGGGWVYQAPDQGNNPGAEGAHYYYRSQTQEGSHKTAPAEGRFSFDLDIEQSGVYSILLRVSRDTASPGDARNDIWIKVGDDTQDMIPGDQQLSAGGEGFVKYKAGPPAQKWIDAKVFSTPTHGDSNAPSDVLLPKGVHTITFAPRSTGFHIDSVQIVQRSVIPDPEPPVDTTTVTADVASRPNDFETVGGAYDTDLDLGTSGGAANQVGLRFTGLDIPAGAEIESAHIVFTASEASAAGGSLTIQLQNFLGAVNFVAGGSLASRAWLPQSVTWDNVGAWSKDATYNSADVSDLIKTLIADGGLDAVNALAFRIAGTGAHSAYSFESGGVAPRLVVTYSDGTTGTPAPVLTATAAIARTADDFETRHGAGNDDLDFGIVNGQANSVGLRFTGLEIEAGAEIESAYFVFTANAAAAAGGSLAIQIQQSLGAQDFVSGKYLDNRSFLPGTETWSDIGAWEKDKAYRSADISDLIEALVADGGLEALDALAFRITGSGERSAYSFDSAGAAPQLVINYVETL